MTKYFAILWHTPLKAIAESITESRNHGESESRSHGITELRSYGITESRSHGITEFFCLRTTDFSFSVKSRKAKDERSFLRLRVNETTSFAELRRIGESELRNYG